MTDTHNVGNLTCHSLRDVLEAEQACVKNAVGLFPHDLNLLQQIDDCFGARITSAGDIFVRPNTSTYVELLIHAWRFWRLAVCTILRGHFVEYMALLRPAVEAAAQSALMFRDNSAMQIWKDRMKDFSAYRKTFSEKNLFPETDGDLQGLKIAYDNCCKFASHCDPTARAFEYDIENRNDRVLVKIRGPQIHPTETRRVLLATAKVGIEICYIFHRCGIQGQDGLSDIDAVWKQFQGLRRNFKQENG